MICGSPYIAWLPVVVKRDNIEPCEGAHHKPGRITQKPTSPNSPETLGGPRDLEHRDHAAHTIQSTGNT